MLLRPCSVAQIGDLVFVIGSRPEAWPEACVTRLSSDLFATVGGGEIGSDLGELVEGGLQILDDLGGQDGGIGEI